MTNLGDAVVVKVSLVLMVIGVALMIAAIVFPAQSVEILLKPFGLIVEVTPEGIKIKGTQIDAAILEFAIGVALLILGYMRHREEP
jgi:hypothetical protein